MESIYNIQSIPYKKKEATIVLQNVHGASAFVALVNVLLLRNEIQIPTDTNNVAYDDLFNKLKIRLKDNTSRQRLAELRVDVNKITNSLSVMSRKISLNPIFGDIASFDENMETNVFKVFGVKLVHGYHLDPEDSETATLLQNKSYKDIAEKSYLSKILERHLEMFKEGGLWDGDDVEDDEVPILDIPTSRFSSRSGSKTDEKKNEEKNEEKSEVKEGNEEKNEEENEENRGEHEEEEVKSIDEEKALDDLEKDEGVSVGDDVNMGELLRAVEHKLKAQTPEGQTKNAKLEKVDIDVEKTEVDTEGERTDAGSGKNTTPTEAGSRKGTTATKPEGKDEVFGKLEHDFSDEEDDCRFRSVGINTDVELESRASMSGDILDKLRTFFNELKVSRTFCRKYPAQLTPYGLRLISNNLGEDNLAVLYGNSRFHVVMSMGQSVYGLATHRNKEANVVWKVLGGGKDLYRENLINSYKEEKVETPDHSNMNYISRVAKKFAEKINSRSSGSLNGSCKSKSGLNDKAQASHVRSGSVTEGKKVAFADDEAVEAARGSKLDDSHKKKLFATTIGDASQIETKLQMHKAMEMRNKKSTQFDVNPRLMHPDGKVPMASTDITPKQPVKGTGSRPPAKTIDKSHSNLQSPPPATKSQTRVPATTNSRERPNSRSDPKCKQQ